MEWTVPLKSQLRNHQQSLWDNRFDMFAFLETYFK
jgi:hypothetical protein